MFAQLPKDLQRVVLEYLMADEFKKAKEVHDNYVKGQSQNTIKRVEWQVIDQKVSNA